VDVCVDMLCGRIMYNSTIHVQDIEHPVSSSHKIPGLCTSNYYATVCGCVPY
jgi:hypothetical protein